MHEPRNSTIVLVSQKVKDIKTPDSLPRLAETVGGLRKFLHRYAFIPGDKFTGSLEPIRLESNGVLVAELAGSSLSSDSFRGLHPNVKLELDLGLDSYTGPTRVENLFRAVPGSTVDDGGNVQNMLLDMVVLLGGLTEHQLPKLPSLVVASSSDPFEQWDQDTAAESSPFVKYFKLGFEDRYSIQMPWRGEDGCSGTLAITSEPQRSHIALVRLLSEDAVFRQLFRQANCFVSSDPLFELIQQYGQPPFAYVINASTAFRALVAVSSYGTHALLPMNQGEASQVCKLLLQRGQGTDLDQTETPLFPSPFSLVESGVDHDALKVLDQTLEKFTRYNLMHRAPNGTAFVCPISFGAEGGLIVGTDIQTVACFTSVPNEEGRAAIASSFSDIEKPIDGIYFEVGAGDSVAAVLTLFNTVDPGVLIDAVATERAKKHRALMSLARTVFVSVLSRIVGELLLRTRKTYLANVSSRSVGLLLQEVAEKSFRAAERVVRHLPNEGYTEIEGWGIQVVVWQLGQIAYPGEVMSMLSP
jgi:hypothetical protein